MVVFSTRGVGNGDERSVGGVFMHLVDPLWRRIDAERRAPAFQRDPLYIGRQLSAITHVVNAFSPEVRGRENLPARGPALVVGNHSGVFYMPDVWLVGLEIVRRRGLEQPAFALAYDLLFAIPGVGAFLRRIGSIPADGTEAEEALAQGSLVLVYPGGDREACRPWTERNKVELGNHRGFVRLALRTGAPVIPVVAHGAHDIVLVAARGDRIARLLGLDRLRIHVFPLLLGPPFGLVPLIAPPMPAAITVEFLPPLDWSHYGPESADDTQVVSACYEEITACMQDALTRLAAARPHPVARGVANLLSGRPRRVEAPLT